jgi:hypothetical protein
MNTDQKQEDFDKEFDENWQDWLDLIIIDGKLDEQKIKNEMRDLVFIYKQVGEVYCYITGNKLSKPMYYANEVITAYEDELNKLIRDDRVRIIKEIDKLIENDCDYDPECGNTLDKYINIENEEIDDLIDKIMED